MAKRPAKPENEPKDTVTFSVRLTEEQRDHIVRAAAVRGWTATNLLRIAAQEKAAHILNTTSETKVDFRGLAQRIAELLVGDRTAYLFGPDGEKVRGDLVEDILELDDPLNYQFPVQVEPKTLPGTSVPLLRSAARFGGAEFLTLIVDSCEAIARRARGELPDPVDPATF